MRNYANESDCINNFLEDDRDGVIYLSHACFLVRAGGKLVLFDPVIGRPPHLGSWVFYPEIPSHNSFFEVDYVVVSHQHLDHFDVEFLRRLKPDVCIVVIGRRPHFTRIIKDICNNVIIIEPETLFELSAFKLYGILHESNDIDSAIVIASSDFVLYHGNDCYLSDGKLMAIKAAFPRIDVACVPFAYIHWYPYLVTTIEPKERAQIGNKMVNQYMDRGANHVKVLDAIVVIPCGANMFHNDDIGGPLNSAIGTPFDFVDYCRINLPRRLAESVRSLLVGDTIYSNQANGNYNLTILYKETTKAEFLEGLRKYIANINDDFYPRDRIKFRDAQGSLQCDARFLIERMKHLDAKSPDAKIVIGCAVDDQANLAIDLLDKSFSWVYAPTDADDHEFTYHITLSSIAWRAYLSGKYSLGDIMATSMFTISRSPETYEIEILRILNNIL